MYELLVIFGHSDNFGDYIGSSPSRNVNFFLVNFVANKK